MKKDEPAPCCGASGEARGIWPWHGGNKLLEIVYEQDLIEFEERRVAIVFLHSALEFLMEQSLWELLSDLFKTHNKVTEAMLESNEGIHKRIELYKKIYGRTLNAIFQENGFVSFFQDWKQLIKLRNGIVHGKYYRSTSNETEIIENVRDCCISAFASLHNNLQKNIRGKMAL
ncbi:MAG: hypothetical protein ACYC4D_06990 [Thermoleophilia bacterium]